MQIYNALVPSGVCQIGARVALEQPPHDLATANAEWQRRRDETLRQLDGLPANEPVERLALLGDLHAALRAVRAGLL